eukprot:2001606-Amphidinium_carterae.1
MGIVRFVQFQPPVDCGASNAVPHRVCQQLRGQAHQECCLHCSTWKEQSQNAVGHSREPMVVASGGVFYVVKPFVLPWASDLRLVMFQCCPNAVTLVEKRSNDPLREKEHDIHL